MDIRGTIFDSAYAAGYSLLSRMPEDKAIKYGQWVLKNLPVEYFTPRMDRSDGVRVTIS